VSCKGRSVGKEVEEGGTGGGSASYKGKSTARRVEKEFVGDIKEEGRMVLWINSAMRCRVVEAGMAWPRSHCHISKVPKMWQRGMLHGVMSYKTLGKLSDILHLNNRNNQLKRQARPPRNVPLDA